MPVDIIALTSVATGGVVMLLQTLFTSKCTHIECCSDEGCMSCDRKVTDDKDEKNNKTKKENINEKQNITEKENEIDYLNKNLDLKYNDVGKSRCI